MRSSAGCDGGGDVLCISIAGILDCPCFILQAEVGGRGGGNGVADGGVDDVVCGCWRVNGTHGK